MFLPVRARRTHSPAGGVKTVKLFHGVILLCKNKTAGSQVTSRCDKRTLRLQKPLRHFGKADGCYERRKTCTCTWACTSASSSCCGQTASYCFLLSSVFCCWHSTPGGRICQPGFSHFVIFSKKEKFITSRFVNWTRFFRISGDAQPQDCQVHCEKKLKKINPDFRQG